MIIKKNSASSENQFICTILHAQEPRSEVSHLHNTDHIFFKKSGGLLQ